MKPELKDFHKSISDSRKETENELHCLQVIERLIKDSDGKQWVKISADLKMGLAIARIPGEGGNNKDLFFAVENTMTWGLREYPTSDSEDSIFDFFPLDELEILV
jgi:hypothetical protein